MIGRRGYFLRCDVAGCTGQINLPDAVSMGDARDEAAVEGWAFVSGCDYCPRCAELPDVKAARAEMGGGR